MPHIASIPACCFTKTGKFLTGTFFIKKNIAKCFFFSPQWYWISSVVIKCISSLPDFSSKFQFSQADPIPGFSLNLKNFFPPDDFLICGNPRSPLLQSRCNLGENNIRNNLCPWINDKLAQNPKHAILVIKVGGSVVLIFYYRNTITFLRIHKILNFGQAFMNSKMQDLLLLYRVFQIHLHCPQSTLALSKHYSESRISDTWFWLSANLSAIEPFWY